jgi:hypothetical protein
MSGSWRRLGLSLTLAVATVSAGVVGAGTAHAATPPVASGNVTFGGNDWISANSAHSFSTSNGDYITVVAGSNTGLTVGFGTSVQNETGWLSFQAPAGQQLAVGTYTGALRANTPSAPGLDLTFDFRGCNTVTGSFTIYQFAVGADGSIDSLNATFDQVCDNGPGETQGRVLINVAGPPAQAITASVAATGLVTTSRFGGQQFSVWGTVTCTQAGQVTLTGTLQQTGSPATAQLSGTSTCAPGSAFLWMVSGALPRPYDGQSPPSPGSAVVVVTASGFDPYYLYTATTVSASVQLVQPPPPSCLIPRCARISLR